MSTMSQIVTKIVQLKDKLFFVAYAPELEQINFLINGVRASALILSEKLIFN